MRKFLLLVICSSWLQPRAQHLETPFEHSGGMETATYFECIAFYKKLQQLNPKLHLKEMGPTDAGYPIDLVLYSGDGSADPALWHKQHKIIVLVINGIHPGEPDGVDASMLLLRDLCQGKIRLPDDLALAIIPMYNIGGALNRNSFSRVNQNGPRSYGFRGNAQNLDLNRDFTKCDSRNAVSFSRLFHWLDPDIQLDNHVSDGADYQHTMTLLSAQWNKLGGSLGSFLHDEFEPAIYHSMEQKGWPICPYVNAEEGKIEDGWTAFYDPPRFSNGYASLFHTLAFTAETHMLKPFADRVKSTYALMQAILEEASARARQIRELRVKSLDQDRAKNEFALSWSPDRSHWDSVRFMGYEAAYKTSEVTGQQRLYYDHNKPFTRWVRFYDYYLPSKKGIAPHAYLIPRGWHEVLDLLTANGVRMRPLDKDSTIRVEAYHIDQYVSSPRPYEKHHRNSQLKYSVSRQDIHFLKGDYLIDTDQPARRFLIEMLEPDGDDSYFSWNFFDAVLQEKEGYSDYRWEDVASSYLQANPGLRAKLEEKKAQDSAFNQNASAQLEFVYKNSPYYEPAHLRYPVYRLP